MATLEGKTLFITGATRGIGHAIGLRAAQDGANIVIAAKTTEPHPKLPGTIYTAAEDMEKAGGRALALPVDVRDDAGLRDAMEAASAAFGGIDILVNNASALSLTDTPSTPMKRYDLIMGINVRGTFAATQAALPYLKEAANPHILTLSPPLDMNPRWFRDSTAYTMSKFGMSMCVIGHAAEFARYGIAVNGLWPRTFISTAALKLVPGMDWETARTPGNPRRLRPHHPDPRCKELHRQPVSRRRGAGVGRHHRSGQIPQPSGQAARHRLFRGRLRRIGPRAPGRGQGVPSYEMVYRCRARCRH